MILGIMGEDFSGKTVLIRIISGDLRSSLGTAVIKDQDLVKSRSKYLARVAYCSEKNTIHESLTGFQMVQLMGRLRGMPAEHLNIHVEQWLNLLGKIRWEYVSRTVYPHVCLSH